MSIQFPQPNYKSAGKKFEFSAYIHFPDQTGVTLANDDLLEFVCVNRLNSLYLCAEMRYVDRTGMLDSYRDRQHVLMEVRHVRISEHVDGGFKTEQRRTDNEFAHTFIVEHIGVDARSAATEIVYYIKMRSACSLNCRRLVRFNTYPDGMPATDVIKECMVQSKFDNIDSDSFDECKSSKPIKCISSGRETVQSAMDYVYRMMFYGSFQLQESVPMIKYDSVQNKYFLIDFSKMQHTGDYGENEITLSLDKSEFEQMTNGGRLVQIGVAGGLDKTSQFRRTFDIKTYDYDYDTNKFVTGQIRSKEIVDLYTGGSLAPSRSRSGDFVDKLESVSDPQHELDQDSQFMRKCAYWNNDLDIYGDVTTMMFEQNLPVFNVAGDILRQPGTLVRIGLPDRCGEGLSESQSADKDKRERYSQLRGVWISYSVTDFVSPANDSFTQNIACFRNFNNA